jgi:spermidine/putrescine transport system ATP-binding protein
VPAEQGRLELVNVTKRFGATVAVHDFSLSIGRTEFVSFLGPSGCGKTTTLRMIAGLEQPSSGDILLGDTRLNGLEPYERNISLVFQSFALFPHMTVFDNVAYGLRLQKLPKTEVASRVRTMLESVEMTQLADRRPAQLSGGQQQRVALARALIVDPDVLLLDEPLGSLDAHLRIQMQAELQLLQRRLEIPFIYVTHNQNEALSMSDRVVVMKGGHIEQIAPPVELFSHPRTKFVASFVGNNNILAATTVADAGEVVFDSPAGRFRAAPDAPARGGEPVALVFGADVLEVWQPEMDPASWNRVEGVIDGVEIVGSITTYLVQLASGDELHWEQHGTGKAHLRVAPGAAVTLAWPSELTVVLPEPPERERGTNHGMGTALDTRQAG